MPNGEIKYQRSFQEIVYKDSRILSKFFNYSENMEGRKNIQPFGYLVAWGAAREQSRLARYGEDHVRTCIPRKHLFSNIRGRKYLQKWVFVGTSSIKVLQFSFKDNAKRCS